MDEKLLARYLTVIMEKEGLTDKMVADRCNASAETVKNLRLGKTENPGILTSAPIIYAANGSVDEMLGFSHKSKNETEENFANAIKELCEYQLKMNETHINNIRTHYEQHREDSVNNYEMRLSDKREIIDQQNEHILSLKRELAEQSKTLKKERNIAFSCALFVASILVGLLILEVMNPNLGWIKF